MQYSSVSFISLFNQIFFTLVNIITNNRPVIYQFISYNVNIKIGLNANAVTSEQTVEVGPMKSSHT